MPVGIGGPPCKWPRFLIYFPLYVITVLFEIEILVNTGFRDALWLIAMS